ncbi:MAG: nitroreductase family protein [Methylophilaceae bacterium]|jgi:nitroreductase
MDFKKLVKERRSIKHFDREHSMHKDEVRELFELTLLSPTAFNLQHWRFTVVENKNLREEIKSVSFNQSQVTDASLLVVISGDLDAWKKNPKKYWRNADHKTQDLMGSMIHGFYNQKTQIQRDEVMRSCSMAAMTLMLAAQNLGYDSCPMDGFDFDAVAKLLNFPKNQIPIMFVAIGKKTKEAWPRGGQLSMNEVVSFIR